MITQAQHHFMHSIHYQYAPKILRPLRARNTERNIKHNLYNAHEYTLPRANYTFYKKTQSYSFAAEWNSAPLAIPTFTIQLNTVTS